MTNTVPSAPRKPAVYFLVILPVFVAGAVGIVAGLDAVYARMARIPHSWGADWNSLAASVPALLLWIPISLLLANCILFAVPPFRRIAQRYMAQAQGPGFIEAQKQLAIAALVMALFCVPAIVSGLPS